MVRGGLRRLNAYLSRRYDREEAKEHPAPPIDPPGRLGEAEEQLRGLDLEGEGARAYLEKHLPRLARTLTLIPVSTDNGAVLELGCDGQITPFLKSFCGYSMVRGGFFGPEGITEDKFMKVRGKVIHVKVDLFDAERDRFPYEDESFNTVLVCELIEHLIRDPIQMLLECRRVLKEGGRVVVTTPNVASLTSVARVLHGYDNPQVYSQYSIPSGDSGETPHVREYTAHELGEAVKAAGFELETLITEPIEEWAKHLPIRNFLESQGYNSALRGEQTYCVAIKRGSLPVNRFPTFLYS
jgi:SAM-dependent methyltransferase